MLPTWARPAVRGCVWAHVLASIAACARIGSPPGGAEDKVPPKLLATVPDSTGIYPGWKSDVEFKFDEVISEGGQPNMGLGTGDIEKLVLLSPSKGIPVVRWKRDRITVRPREGWRPNRVYRIELLPGLADLRRNRLDTTKVITFTTGAPLPTDTLSGMVVDWVANAVARQALVELVLRPDSLVYRTITDSSGRFRIGPLPHAEYLIFGAVDQNKNNRREQREAYDSTLIAAGARVPALWIIPRDTIGPRIQTAVPADSTGALLTLTQPIDPYQPLDSVLVTVRLQSDSSEVPVLALRTQERDDTLQRQARERADSIRIANDTTIKKDTAAKAKPVVPAPAPLAPGMKKPKVDLEADSLLRSRPPLTTRLVVRTRQPLKADTKYLVELRGLRSAAGRVNPESRQVLVMPKAPPPPPPDSTASDSIKVAPADSTHAPPVRLPADAPKPKKP
ncbi:MAG TPA: carboxypeptidase-like regulatory domain-containing protein [Gemmatimonadales bacterium]|nr:carboxypeptidase-like regulatory domain-containing protein [Gemmatimonadales bacterium]